MPVLVELRFAISVVFWPRIWRFDARICHDAFASARLRQLIEQLLAHTNVYMLYWDRLKNELRLACSIVGQALRRHHRLPLQDTMEHIRNVQRGGVNSLALRSYLEELQRDYFRLLRNSTAVFASLHARGGPLTHS